MTKPFALVLAGLVSALVPAGHLPRASGRYTVIPNDSEPYWSWDSRQIAFDRESPGSADVDVHTVPAGHGRERWLGPTRARGWRPGGGGLLVEYAGRTNVVTPGSGAAFGGVDGIDATWSPDGGRIAYLDGDALDVADATGSHVRQLAGGIRPPSWDITGPAWSPDGSAVAVASSDGFGSSFISVIAADGSRITRAFSGEDQNVNPAWSPGGHTIAFERNASSHWSIWLVGADGTGAHEAIGGSADNRFPQWGPADRLSFISDREHVPGEATRYRYALYVQRLGEGAPRKLVDDVRPDSMPRWSPTGLQLAVAAGQECRRWGIYVVGYDGGVLRRRTNRCRFEGGPGNDVLRGTPYLDYLRGLAGDDRMLAGGGNDTIVGGPGRDRIWAGSGNDRVEARDGYRDVVDCGAGRDVAEVDRRDVAHGCERILKPRPPGSFRTLNAAALP